VSSWGLGWLAGLTAWNMLLTWWAMVDDVRIKRFEGKR
jgi:hypothetical protein